MIDTRALTVGQEVVIRDGYSGRPIFGYRVTRVTPRSGRVTVEKTIASKVNVRQFNSAGRELTGWKSAYRDYLDVDVEKSRALEEQKQRQIAAYNALAALVMRGELRATWSKESMQREVARLRELLDAAERAVEAI